MFVYNYTSSVMDSWSLYKCHSYYTYFTHKFKINC